MLAVEPRGTSVTDEHAGWVRAEYRRAADRLTVAESRGQAVADRWRRLVELARSDLSVARLTEAHADALVIAAELRGPLPQPRQYWAVWAAEPPNGRVRATYDGERWRLHGTKRWCSGVGICTHALVTAHWGAERRLFAVAMDEGGGTVGTRTWQGAGMSAASTGTVEFVGMEAIEVGKVGEYLARPGFWHGAMAVASCWFGGARGVAAPLYTAGEVGKLDQHGLAHLGAVDSALHGASCALDKAAEEVTVGALAEQDVARREALRVRSIVESAATLTMDRVGRALGPGPLAHDADHARRVGDLTVYLRQSHAERDLADLGGLVAATKSGTR